MMRARNMPTTLRGTVDVVTLVAALLLIGGLGAYRIDAMKESAAAGQVTTDLGRFEQMIQLRAATKESTLNARGWPVTIDPAWFDGAPPRNSLLSPDRPWVEVATPEEADLLNPRLRAAVDTTLASFWYNPYRGIIRARVPLRINDRKTIDLYNSVNRTSLDAIYDPIEESPRDAADAVPDEPPAPQPSVEDFSEGAMDPTKGPGSR